MIFIHRPTVGVAITYKPRIRKAQFGDGYAQRTAQGININPRVWDLTFGELDDTTADEIENFLKSVSEKAEAFDWVDLTGVSRKYICEEFSRSYSEEDVNDIRAKFEQYFG